MDNCYQVDLNWKKIPLRKIDNCILKIKTDNINDQLGKMAKHQRKHYTKTIKQQLCVTCAVFVIFPNHRLAGVLNVKKDFVWTAKEHHSLLKATRNHNIIPFSEYQKLPQNVLEITRNCEKHNEVLQIFCKNTIVLAEENLTSLQEEKKRIENDIAQTRIKINNHLDKLQANLIQTLYAKVKKANGKIEQLLKSLEEKQCQINEYQNTFENIKKYATDVQLFLSMKLMETTIEKVEEFMRSLKEGESLCQVMLVMKDTFDTETIAVSMPYIGKIGIDYSPSQVSIMKKKEMQAQTKATKTTIKSIANVFLKFEKKISACEAGVTGCTLLPHGKLHLQMQRKAAL
ncbi:unnamed protein product [Mytilus edulis]|uniref:Uncharacterized protein n=1 Tax=Mytilus edulis TaxID=6550 RepID=A0A8S3RVE5_MYTED|nr:unnamed protein product [Mytilus edulis]